MIEFWMLCPTIYRIKKHKKKIKKKSIKKVNPIEKHHNAKLNLLV